MLCFFLLFFLSHKVPIHVIADPVDQKLGVGGSTLHVLSEMTKIYGSELHQKKLLIIHSGVNILFHIYWYISWSHIGSLLFTADNYSSFILNAGGSSQRLPSYSVIGKIFAPVPCQGKEHILIVAVITTTLSLLSISSSLFIFICKIWCKSLVYGCVLFRNFPTIISLSLFVLWLLNPPIISVIYFLLSIFQQLL